MLPVPIQVETLTEYADYQASENLNRSRAVVGGKKARNR